MPGVRRGSHDRVPERADVGQVHGIHDRAEDLRVTQDVGDVLLVRHHHAHPDIEGPQLVADELVALLGMGQLILNRGQVVQDGVVVSVASIRALASSKLPISMSTQPRLESSLVLKRFSRRAIQSRVSCGRSNCEAISLSWLSGQLA